MRLLIFDVGGVFRDSSRAVDEGFRRGFIHAGRPYNFRREDVWHLRGIGKYNSSLLCIKALLTVQKSGENLDSILKKENSEEILDFLVAKNISSEDLENAEKIRQVYKNYFSSHEAKSLIHTFDFSKEALEILSKNYRLAIFSNSSKISVERDLADLKEFFSVILGGEDVSQPKPSGEGILNIISLLNCGKSETAYVGDTDTDISAARNAGVKSIAVCSGMSSRDYLARLKPEGLFENILEMAKKI
jgi:HAD superfamily hydrolase (TIGR01549 family)